MIREYFGLPEMLLLGLLVVAIILAPTAPWEIVQILIDMFKILYSESADVVRALFR